MSTSSSSLASTSSSLVSSTSSSSQSSSSGSKDAGPHDAATDGPDACTGVVIDAGYGICDPVLVPLACFPGVSPDGGSLTQAQCNAVCYVGEMSFCRMIPGQYAGGVATLECNPCPP